MPRSLRVDLPGIAQHVIQRGNDRRPCFFVEIDYIRYLQDLREIARRESCAVHAYVLMTNHVHLLMTPGAAGRIGRTMQALGRRYVRYVNDRHGRTGTLWEGRYKACPVGDGRYLLQCHRYIELNPLRAKMVADPADYAWSSFAVTPSARPIPWSPRILHWHAWAAPPKSGGGTTGNSSCKPSTPKKPTASAGTFNINASTAPTASAS